jgi:hypothetical protein
VIGEDEVSAGQAPGQPVFDSYGHLSWNPTTREPEKIETQHADDERDRDTSPSSPFIGGQAS